ncbi:uroporphyrinogen-III C-methyltransferase [Pseudovibrio sp. SPO723]|uniref:uroporphyrinogen-III C-methyltransferase n=1 Tax=Nesiotobacter zosterae TaxID=392721 RepID=UPI0029C3ED6A|nr:uroporphyrinogen-III C-methyltransferase [Pseudovibrio sp. SPO723]MDX5592232.1 uroporphyrinogen-III C-methyltransferase [Pseudovibrio sp. SPO723]
MNSETPLPLPSYEFPEFQHGTVWLTGAGPGDPGLLSLLALHALRHADVIVYDALVDERILSFARPGTMAEYAGKRGGKPSPQQRDISLRLIELARAGKRVLRLKGGDPFVFGRGGEEALTLVAAGIQFRIVPGITAGVGGLAYAGIPTTHRDVNQAVTFLTGHDQTGLTPDAIDWTSLAKSSPVIVMYMAMKHLQAISQKLLAAGRHPDEPVALVSNATLNTQQVLETTLANCKRDADAHDLKPPALVVIGDVVRLRAGLDWLGQAHGRILCGDPLGLRSTFEASKKA